MSITAKYNKPAEERDVSLGRTIIDWDNQILVFQLNCEKSHIHKLTKAQWNYLTSGLKSLMNKIPNISDIEIPEFNPNIDEENAIPV